MLVSLSARRFRNLAPFDWHPGPGVHLLLGGNGAGKTSLLEAIYVLATTKSFRTSQIADCARRGEASFELAGEVEGAARVDLGVTWSRAVAKQRTVNGRSGSLADHLAALPVVAWTAAEAEWVTGAPELRRRLLDRGVVGLKPAALELLGRFRQALLAKRELLSRPESRSGRGDGGDQLDAWNEIVAGTGAEVIRLRRAYARQLAERLAEVLAEAGLRFPAIDLSYRPSPARDGDDPAAFLDRLRRLAERERQRGQPLVGPQRDDLAILWDGWPPKGSVSAGERKALGLALLAAQARVLSAAGRPPVVLLDDADAELAPATLGALWPVFAGAAQLFASSNRPRVWEPLAVGAVHRLEGGVASFSGTPQATS